MAEASFKWYFLSFVIASLFFVSIFSFGNIMLVNHHKTGTVLDESSIDSQNLQDRLEATNEEGENLVKSFTEDEISFATGVLALRSVFGIMKNLIGTIFAFMNIIVDFFYGTLGIPFLALGVFVLIICVGVIFAGWRLLHQGE